MGTKNIHIGIIGLGYVGLPLAVEFGKKYKTAGFDINVERISELNNGKDHTLEISDAELFSVLQMGFITFSSEAECLSRCNVYIITVPTPVDKTNRPDLSPLERASETVGKFLKINDIVIYESTVYPGVTEEVCVPILEKTSGLIYNKDFFVGYSPERVNPGDKSHTVSKIVKVTSGSTSEAALFIDDLYKSIIKAGTFKASSIKVAEAAKVIENTQRDINIAFVNELSKIFNRVGIDTADVLEAAATKWNFLKFKPGLVGGHCIGVDPYYLAQKAQSVGYHPEIILAGRRINDGMGSYVAGETVKLMIKKGTRITAAKVLIMGFTFKENCPDIRNTKVIDIYNELRDYDIDVDVYDPWVSPLEIKAEYGIDIITDLNGKRHGYDGVVLAVSHDGFANLDFKSLMKENGILYDVKSFLPKKIVDGRL